MQFQIQILEQGSEHYYTTCFVDERNVAYKVYDMLVAMATNPHGKWAEEAVSVRIARVVYGELDVLEEYNRMYARRMEPMVKEYDPEFEKLLAEEEHIENQTRDNGGGASLHSTLATLNACGICKRELSNSPQDDPLWENQGRGDIAR